MTTIGRRAFVLGVIAVAAQAAGAGSVAAASEAQLIVDRFTAARTMSGSFVQIGPRGDQSEGRFMIERPGKVRFDYLPPSSLQLVSDGSSVAVGNSKLRTWDLYPLSKTPLKLLLGDRVDMADSRVSQVSGQEGLVSVTLADPELFGNASVEVMFDASTSELRQWNVTDSRRETTAVVVFDVKVGETFRPGTFRIPYSEIRTLK